MDIGTTIRRLRRTKGLTQEEQAGKIILTVEKEFGVEISEMNFK